ncbi:hypothetical protein ACFL96_00450 [Thermoproteota archaeon]
MAVSKPGVYHLNFKPDRLLQDKPKKPESDALEKSEVSPDFKETRLEDLKVENLDLGSLKGKFDIIEKGLSTNFKEMVAKFFAINKNKPEIDTLLSLKTAKFKLKTTSEKNSLVCSILSILVTIGLPFEKAEKTKIELLSNSKVFLQKTLAHLNQQEMTLNNFFQTLEQWSNTIDINELSKTTEENPNVLFRELVRIGLLNKTHHINKNFDLSQANLKEHLNPLFHSKIPLIIHFFHRNHIQTIQAFTSHINDYFELNPEDVGKTVFESDQVMVMINENGQLTALLKHLQFEPIDIPKQNQRLTQEDLTRIQQEFNTISSRTRYSTMSQNLAFLNYASKLPKGVPLKEAYQLFSVSSNELSQEGSGDCITIGETLIDNLARQGIKAFMIGQKNDQLTKLPSPKNSDPRVTVPWGKHALEYSGQVTHADVLIPYTDESGNKMAIHLITGSGSGDQYIERKPLNEMLPYLKANKYLLDYPDGGGISKESRALCAKNPISIRHTMMACREPGYDKDHVFGINLMEGSLFISTKASEAFRVEYPESMFENGRIKFYYRDVVKNSKTEVKIKLWDESHQKYESVSMTFEKAFLMFLDIVETDFKLSSSDIMFLLKNEGEYIRDILLQPVQAFKDTWTERVSALTTYEQLESKVFPLSFVTEGEISEEESNSIFEKLAEKQLIASHPHVTQEKQGFIKKKFHQDSPPLELGIAPEKETRVLRKLQRITQGYKLSNQCDEFLNTAETSLMKNDSEQAKQSYLNLSKFLADST